MSGIGISVGILVVALVALLKGADIFLVGAKALGVRLGISRFVIGVLIVGFGTSVPELASSIAGVLAGETSIVLSTVVGSNISNILLIGGLLVFMGGHLYIKRDLLHTELPLFFIATAHFLLAVSDGVLDRLEALLLFATFGAYLWYIFTDTQVDVDIDDVPKGISLPRIVLYIALGLAGVVAGAHYAIVSAIGLASLTAIPIGVISILAIAVGTSLPELVVSLTSLKSGETEMAIGNIFGSNAFNLLFVASVPAFITPLVADKVVMELGLGVLLVASLLLFVAGLAQRIMRFEGLMLLFFFGFFLVKLFAFI